MNKDLEEGIEEMVRKSRALTQQNVRLAVQAETAFRRYRNAKSELENGWFYLLVTISVIALIYVANTR